VFLIVSVIIRALRSSEDEPAAGWNTSWAHEVQSFLQNQPSPSWITSVASGSASPMTISPVIFFDLVRFAPTKLAIVVGDICGKGISAACWSHTAGLYAAMCSVTETWRAHGDRYRALYHSTAEDKFATLFIESMMMIVELTYVNAGHDSARRLR